MASVGRNLTWEHGRKYIAEAQESVEVRRANERTAFMPSAVTITK